MSNNRKSHGSKQKRKRIIAGIIAGLLVLAMLAGGIAEFAMRL